MEPIYAKKTRLKKIDQDLFLTHNFSFFKTILQEKNKKLETKNNQKDLKVNNLILFSRENKEMDLFLCYPKNYIKKSN